MGLEGEKRGIGRDRGGGEGTGKNILSREGIKPISALLTIIGLRKQLIIR